jgi:phosphatidylserine/phosphatidylglycerophosphate/cardiolipin synthase-like enzyme
MSTEFIINKDIYEKVIQEKIPYASKFVWIGTSDLKDLYVKKKSRMVPFLEILSDLIKKGVEIRLIHAKEPGEAFREDFDKYPALIGGMERLLCPRVHFKIVIVDGKFAYTRKRQPHRSRHGFKKRGQAKFRERFYHKRPCSRRINNGSVRSCLDGQALQKMRPQGILRRAFSLEFSVLSIRFNSFQIKFLNKVKHLRGESIRDRVKYLIFFIARF